MAQCEALAMWRQHRQEIGNAVRKAQSGDAQGAFDAAHVVLKERGDAPEIVWWIMEAIERIEQEAR